MKINRTELLGLLKMLTPALANSKNQVQELAQIWFSGEHMSAFNDVLGIRIAFATEFTGGVLGEKLIGVLERSRAKEIDLGLDGDDALLKIGAARIKLTRRPIEDWFWQPEIPEGDGYIATKTFREAIDAALLSVGTSNTLNPEQRGITIIQNGKAADLYSTDAVSMSWVTMDTSKQPLFDHSDRLIMPTLFCEQIKSLKGDAELRFDENAVYCLTAVDPSGKKESLHDVLVFSKLIEDENPVAFDDVVKQHVNGEEGVEIPTQMKLRAERAMVLLGNQPVELEIADKNLYLYAQTPYGEVDDVLKIGDHPEIKVKIDVSLLVRAFDSCDRMRVAKNGVVMTGPKGFTHIVATK